MKIQKNSFGEKAVNFFLNLKSPYINIAEINTINPYIIPEVRETVRSFFGKYFNDYNKRIFIIGINPGRFGGGITGISFTDPINLENKCGITNPFEKRPELSSRFIYLVIDKFGGADRFFSKFFLTALYPLALLKNGKNYNYYDSRSLYSALKNEIIASLNNQIKFGADPEIAICLSRKNEKYLTGINEEIKYFKKIITLEHPRYIMQYKLKKSEYYIEKYLNSMKLINTLK